MAYDAFISYSHAADRRLAAAIQRGVERLGRAPYQPRALHVFRDDTSLAVSPELWGAIAKELEAATWFVLLCCPDAAASNGKASRMLARTCVASSSDLIPGANAAQ